MLQAAEFDRGRSSRYAAHAPLVSEQRQGKSPALFPSPSSLVLSEESEIGIIYTQNYCWRGPFLVAVMASGVLY